MTVICFRTRIEYLRGEDGDAIGISVSYAYDPSAKGGALGPVTCAPT
jgi:hypothetical protein